MAKPIRTIRLRLIEALEKRGWVLDTAAITRKYIVLRKDGSLKKYYVGKSGALRSGATIAASLSMDNTKAILLKETP